MRITIEEEPTRYTPDFGHFFHEVNSDVVYLRLKPWIPKHFTPQQVEGRNSIIHALCVSFDEPRMQELPINGNYLPIALWNCDEGHMHFKPIDEFWRNEA